jgi:hypothetical protein
MEWILRSQSRIPNQEKPDCLFPKRKAGLAITSNKTLIIKLHQRCKQHDRAAHHRPFPTSHMLDVFEQQSSSPARPLNSPVGKTG